MRRTVLATFKHRLFYLFAILAAIPLVASASELDNTIQKIYERKFASTVLLTDTEAVQFGIHNFNPNAILNTSDDELGTPESIQNRNTVSVYSLPYTLSFPSKVENDRHLIRLKLFWIHTDSEFSIYDTSTIDDELTEDTYGGSIGYAYLHQWLTNVTVTHSLTTHFMFYENTFKPNSLISSVVSELLSGRAVNTKAWANLYQPAISFAYTQPESWGRWQLSSSWNYVYGYGGGEANQGRIGNPETWYTVNKALVDFDLPKFKYVQSMFLGFERVDLSGDAQAEFNTNHYYEASIGYLIHNPLSNDLVDNIGIGLNFNYGSDFKGGSIVLYFNK
ncbi:Solitary outer membrane autotransporter beta-barrel domain [Vibrio astriarenae]|uniref:Solitary outer membrane autotransporter beta-barrel domain n=1 Tax=Vibrio astriarenae TaxID=1481923 RepID=UPI0037368B68